MNGTIQKDFEIYLIDNCLNSFLFLFLHFSNMNISAQEHQSYKIDNLIIFYDILFYFLTETFIFVVYYSFYPIHAEFWFNRA